MKVSIGVSNRHVHLKEEHLKILFGNDFILEKKNDLTQPGQYASTSLVTIKTEKSEIGKVRVLGPVRPYTQVEISKTDSYKLGLNPPVRDSGDLKGSSPITIIGPNGIVELEEGCIIPTRHIHILPSQVSMYDLEDRDTVSVKIDGEKGGIINNVHLKVSDESFFELHIDTDDANAHLTKNGDIGEII
ncbi:MAG: phosphate propanoyltransferase [Firmicutes bacterium]|nr:phosphate propanoyltransferase [Bacillota bacterium]